MAPTSDERREVAAMLREAWPEAGGMEEVWEVLDPILGTHDGPDVYKAWEQTFNRLSDLIDPTCEMVVKNGHACCGRCGHRLADECEVEEDYYEFRPFCPDCGARVTNGGEG